MSVSVVANPTQSMISRGAYIDDPYSAQYAALAGGPAQGLQVFSMPAARDPSFNPYGYSGTVGSIALPVTSTTTMAAPTMSVAAPVTTSVQYAAPAVQYSAAPAVQYSAPTVVAEPAPVTTTVETPVTTTVVDTPAVQYSAAPAVQYSAPTMTYAAPTTTYAAPTTTYAAAPTMTYAAPTTASTTTLSTPVTTTVAAPSTSFYTAPTMSMTSPRIGMPYAANIVTAPEVKPVTREAGIKLDEVPVKKIEEKTVAAKKTKKGCCHC